MCRTTDGVEWIKEFTGREMQMFIVLNNMENIETHMVSLTPLSREHIYKFFGITKSTFANLISGMEEKRFLLRLSKSDIILNPMYFYKGESKEVFNRMKEFNTKYDERRRESPKKSIAEPVTEDSDFAQAKLSNYSSETLAAEDEVEYKTNNKDGN